MKRILALLLAALMLLSCTALAESNPAPTFNPEKGKDAISFTPGSLTGNDDSNLDIKTGYISRHYQENGTEGDVKTELWIQVEANGQIDVTVPLILVFSTNVDGGTATAATNYKIYNNNARNSIAVDKIVVENTGSAKMNFVDSDAFDALDLNARDYYAVTMDPIVADGTATNKGTDNSLDMKTYDHKTEVYDLFKAIGEEDTDYDESGADKTHVALMTLGQKGIMNLNPTMKTTPLTFTTTQATDNAESAQIGVHLLNVTYTVALQYTSGQGGSINPSDDTNY